MRRLLATCIAMAVMVPSVASACSIYIEPMLPNESDEAYHIRVAAKEKEQAERWAKERQEIALAQAELIFIARARDWTPPDPPQPQIKLRPGQIPPPPAPIKPVLIDPYNAKSYFKPIAWFRGDKVTDLFVTYTSMTSCGFMGFGDVRFPQPGNLFLFFARKTPLNSDTLIDAIALDKIDNPELIDFVANYREKK